MFHVCDLDCKEYADRDHPIPGRWQLGQWEFDRCPRTYITESVEDWILAYRMFKNGYLPNKGGWLNQSSKFLEMVLFIDAEIIKHGQPKE